jgi:1,4-dihydroxy-2-naphthoyl-CoA hydrolase
MHTAAVPDDLVPDMPARSAVPPDFATVLPPENCFDALYGLELIEMAPDGQVARGRVLIRDELRQPTGLLHGGVIAAVAEALASWGTWQGAGGEGSAVMGMSNDTSFLRPLINGHLNAVATPRHRGRTRWQWEVQALDDDGRLCAVTTVNIAIRSRTTA